LLPFILHSFTTVSCNTTTKQSSCS